MFDPKLSEVFYVTASRGGTRVEVAKFFFATDAQDFRDQLGGDAMVEPKRLERFVDQHPAHKLGPQRAK